MLLLPFPLSTVLEEYVKAPQEVPRLNNLQARLLITPKYMGSLSSGIKVYTYDRISASDKAKYEAELNKIVQEIRNDFFTVLADRRTKAASK